tara:strand:- start:12922 stop:13116 length:195 start_codon:yes stop_codon:yes gene_type:complete
MNKSFLDMTILDLETKANMLKAIKESNSLDDLESSKIITAVYESIQKGNQEIINSIKEYILNTN